MNAVKHCQISMRRWGGVEEDYIDIHEFIDHTKSLCADARHRVFHTHWALNHIIVPIFGHTMTNSEGVEVNVKDMCERDHLLVDYQNKFIPTLADFVNAISSSELPSDIGKRIERLHADVIKDSQVTELMLSPLANTGKLSSLLITHNSWFVNSILPRIFSIQPILSDFIINPSMLFNSMEFELWMDNGMALPNSAKKMDKKIII